MRYLREFWILLKETYNEFTADPAMSLGAATAYYAIFSIGPLLVLIVGLAGLVFGPDAVRTEIERQLKSFVGQKSAKLIESMMSAQVQGGSLMATIIGAVALIFGTTGVFSQLQTSLNMIWGVAAEPGHSIWIFIRDRVLSLAMVLAIGFLLLISMALSAIISALTFYVSKAISLPPWILPAGNGVVSFLVISLLFGMVFKVLPDVRIHWRDVVIGAMGTAVLFTAGKYLLGVYLAHEISASAYGTGSALVVVLIFVYYASLILYFGAEFTQVYARRYGAKIRPSRYAVRMTRPRPVRRRRRRASGKGRRTARTARRASRRPPAGPLMGNGHSRPPG